MKEKQKIIINGKTFFFEPGDTIFTVAERNRTDIPTLCHLKRTLPTGACRICVVEVENARTLLPACATPATHGMIVQTQSKKVVEARRLIITLLLQSGNHNCIASTADNTNWTDYQLRVQSEDGCTELCPVWGDCLLQDLAIRYRVDCNQFPAIETTYPLEDVNPFIIRDFSRCIKCGRCVQACNEVQVNNAIHFGYRGALTKIVAAGDKPLKDSDCVFCGECVQTCPVGALVEKDARYYIRRWDTEMTRTTCSYCGVGCQLYLHVKDNRVVKVSGVEDVPPNYGSLCVKGRFGYDFIHSPARLKTPMIKGNGGFRKATWDEALDRVAAKFSEIKDAHGSDSLGVLTSARVSNEENYIANKFARAVLKTNNIDHCARL